MTLRHPTTQPPTTNTRGSYDNNGNPYDGPSGCMIDGQQVPCSMMMQVLRFGSGVGRDGGSVQFLAREVTSRWFDGPSSGVISSIRIPRDQINDPQDSRPLVGFEHIWEDLADIIKDGLCRSFIADLIGTAQEITGKKAHAFSVEGLLAELRKHPKNHPMGGRDGIGLLPTGAGGGAGGWDVDTGLGFANIDNSPYVGSRRSAERDLALVLLHEIIHTATKVVQAHWKRMEGITTWNWQTLYL